VAWLNGHATIVSQLDEREGKKGAIMLAITDRGTGPTVLLIHGFPLSRRMWVPQEEALVGAGFRVVSPDLPGFGESPMSSGPPSLSCYADAVIALLDDLGIDKAVTVGMSMGGYVLLNLVERYPERLRGAVFVVTRAAADDPAGKEKRTMLAAEVGKGNRMIIPETFAKVLFAADTPQKQPELVAMVREWMESTPAEGLAGGLLAMRDREDYVEKLAGFTLPSLVVGAEQDNAVPIEHARRLASLLPAAELKIIPEAGHMVNLEQPVRFNKVLIGFLQGLRQ
jgi:3-oxoadipate enol-lactonase